MFLFDTVRMWAYSAVREYWAKNYEAFHDAVLIQCATENTKFPAQLSYQEFKHIAKSIAKWTWQNTTPEGFSEWCAERGRKGD